MTAQTTGVSNPVCSLRFRVLASVWPRRLPSPVGVPPSVPRFYPSSRNSADPCQTHSPQWQGDTLRLAPQVFAPSRKLWGPPTHAVRPVNANNTRPPRITAAAGTRLAGAVWPATVVVFADRVRLQPWPSSVTGRRWVRLSPIAQYSSLLPPTGAWALSQSQCGCASFPDQLRIAGSL